jgi:hypothetical protein
MAPLSAVGSTADGRTLGSVASRVGKSFHPRQTFTPRFSTPARGVESLGRRALAGLCAARACARRRPDSGRNFCDAVLAGLR